MERKASKDAALIFELEEQVHDLEKTIENLEKDKVNMSIEYNQ